MLQGHGETNIQDVTMLAYLAIISEMDFGKESGFICVREVDCDALWSKCCVDVNRSRPLSSGIIRAAEVTLD